MASKLGQLRVVPEPQGYVLPLRRPWLELGKEALLPLYPWGALTHPLEYLLKRCVHWGDDFDPRIRVYANRQGLSVTPYQSKSNLAVTNPRPPRP